MSSSRLVAPSCPLARPARRPLAWSSHRPVARSPGRPTLPLAQSRPLTPLVTWSRPFASSPGPALWSRPLLILWPHPLRPPRPSYALSTTLTSSIKALQTPRLVGSVAQDGRFAPRKALKWHNLAMELHQILLGTPLSVGKQYSKCSAASAGALPTRFGRSPVPLPAPLAVVPRRSGIAEKVCADQDHIPVHDAHV
jgi:hypothetical protein